MAHRTEERDCPGYAPLPRRLARSRDDLRDREWDRRAGGLHAAARWPRRSRPLVRGVRGHVELRTEFILRFDYGSLVPWVESLDGEGLRAIAGPEVVVLRTLVPLHGRDLTTVGEFTVAVGEVVPFVLSYGPSHLPSPQGIDAERALRETEAFWRDWSDRCVPAGPWSEAVKRSLTVLKGLTYAPTGGIVAAPTTSLPEQTGGVRNWDYRYCWLRDAAFTLMRWGPPATTKRRGTGSIGCCARSPAARTSCRSCTGSAVNGAFPNGRCHGFRGSKARRPVRVGNAAAAQLQLDVYGEILGAMFEAYVHGLRPVERWSAIGPAFLDHLETIWREPDEGIWEVRGPRQHFTHSKVMAWVAFDRAVKSVEQLGVEGSVERWRAVRDAIHVDVCRNGFDSEPGSFVQAYGSKALDASLLLLPMVGFLPPSRSADCRHCSSDRAPTPDGWACLSLRHGKRKTACHRVRVRFSPAASGSSTCILQGRYAEAMRCSSACWRFATMSDCSRRNTIRARSRQMGNFPQAFSHVGLVNTAYKLSQRQ